MIVSTKTNVEYEIIVKNVFTAINCRSINFFSRTHDVGTQKTQ